MIEKTGGAPKTIRTHPGLGDTWYLCGHCQRFRIIVNEEDSWEEKKAEMSTHAKGCRR